MSNLRLINETSATDGVTSISITDIFSSDYDIYKITLSDFEANADFGLDMRFINSSGSEISSSEYDKAKYVLTSHISFVEVNGTNQNYIDRFIDMVGRSTTGQTSNGVFYVFNPFQSSSYTFYLAQGNINTSDFSSVKSIGVLTETTSIGGIKLYSDNTSNTFKTMKIRTYGLRVD